MRSPRQFYDPTDAIIVVVGPRARVQPMIDKLGLPPARDPRRRGERHK